MRLLCALTLVCRGLASIVVIPSLKPVSTILPTFAGWNVDPSCNRGFHRTEFRNPNLLASATGLQPSRLRFGGSGADALVYGLSPGSPECASVAPVGCDYVTPGCLNSSHWEGLYALAANSNTSFIFGVSFGLPDACAAGAAYSWANANASKNAAVLLNYIREKHQSIYAAELGNEVNNNGGEPCNITAASQADAINAFSNMVATALPDTLLVGPDTGGRYPETWLRALLPLVKPGVLHGVTHHVYNGVSRKDYKSPKQLDSPLPEIAWYTSIISDLYPSGEVWAGENGPIGGGDDGTCGTNSTCGTFATTIWYADDMALRARHGFVQHQRQDLWGGAYGLVNSVSGVMELGLNDPLLIRPDYWIAFLWKRTLGTHIIAATSSDPMIRAYAFAGTPPSPFAAPACRTGALQLLLLNLADTTTHVTLPSAPVGCSGTTSSWVLSPPLDAPSPFSTRAALNGALLPVTIDVSVSDPRAFLEHIVQPPRVSPVSSGIDIDASSTAFVCYE